MKNYLIQIIAFALIMSRCSAETSKSDQSDTTVNTKTNSVVLIKARNELDIKYEKKGKDGRVQVIFYGDILTIGVVGQGLEVKNLAKTVVIEYKVLWAERQSKTRHSVDAKKLKDSINALKEIPKMIDALNPGEEIRMEIGGLDINFGNSQKDDEKIQFGSNGYYVDVGGFQHNSDESAESLKSFATEFASFLSSLVDKAESTNVQVIKK